VFAIQTVNSLEITLTLQPAFSDIKIGPGRAHGNRYLIPSTGPDKYPTHYLFTLQAMRKSQRATKQPRLLSSNENEPYILT